MPRKKILEDKERPSYISADGTADISKVFKHQPKQLELLQVRTRDGVPYLRPLAPQCLSVGGIRSGKTVGWLMYMIMNYTLAFDCCDILILRRTFKDLESGAISDFRTFVPKELYSYDQTKHVATFYNGSRVVFGHCLAKGTLVTTQRGLVPIEAVTTQDLVLTRKGYKKVLWSGKTGNKEVSQFGPVQVTEDHKVLCNNSWTSLGELRCQKDSEKTVNLLIHSDSYLKASFITKSVATQLSPELQRSSFATLCVEIPSEQKSQVTEVYDLQVEDEHEFFANGVLVHNCQNNKMRDIEQYLGQAYPAILIDEAGQFSPDAWMMLYSRNTVNAACKPNKYGHMPIPVIVGCTNPLGPYYEYYRTVFVQKEPWEAPEGARKDHTNGTWWSKESGEWINIYDPALYACQRSTVMDNPELLKRDPGIIARLNSMPKAKRDKLLLGLDGAVEGQYFDCFDQWEHVIDLREDPEAIIWQPWQTVIGSQDWGVGHANAAYLFTKAMVRTIGNEYKLKTVCFRETVTSGGRTHKEWAHLFKHMCKLPGNNGELPTTVTPKAIFFSHEKFSKQVTQHTPAEEYSKELKALGLPPVNRAHAAAGDRIGSASLVYNLLKNGELVILDTCKDIINAFPSLMRDPDNLDDVLKVNTRGDDCWDAFRYGIYGMFAGRKKPISQTAEEHAKTLDPLAAHFYRLKMQHEKRHEGAPFVQKEVPVWQGKSGIV
jgi:hypothetical protein